MIAELFYMDTQIWARTPYKANFVIDLKEAIPKDYRRWDPDEKVWVVSYVYEEELLNLCYDYFSSVVQYGRKKYLATTQSSPAYQVLHLLPTAPKEVVMAAYRALSKLYHPDISRDPNATEKMKKVNIAFGETMGRRS